MTTSIKRAATAILALAALTTAFTRAQTPQHAATPKDAAAKFALVEQHAAVVPTEPGKPPITFSITDLMDNYKIPAISIAVIDNFKIVAVKAYGVSGSASPTPVTTKTLFQAGSIGEAVAAAAALSLVEKGELDLDANVNDALKTWKVPDNQFTAKEKVTLRRLLAHDAGTTVAGFAGYDVYSPVPTITQILNGEKPANSQPVRVDKVPGTQFFYSGGGATIEQLLLTDVTGKPFPALMQALVFDKLAMNDSSFDQPLSPERAALTADGTSNTGETTKGRWHIYPEMAVAGLWTTPTDLANFAIEIAESHNGRSNKIISQKSATEMLTPGLGQAGLGVFLNPRNPHVFWYSGATEGFQSTLAMNYETGNGVVILGNSNQALYVEGQLLRTVAREFSWGFKSGDDVMSEIYLLDLAQGPKAALARYADIKRAAAPGRSVDEATLNLIGYLLLNNNRIADAIAILDRNVTEYPKSFNTYDSLAEAYMRNGQKDLAILNYNISLQMEPRNGNAVIMLKKLKEK